LAFLTQTARYHPTIVSNVGSKPIKTAEIFADATRARLGPLPGKATLERTQALLFLGYHEWTELQGEQGWNTIGIAVRCTQCLGYQFDETKKYNSDTDYDDASKQQDDFINREVERRTFWSCFIMDRFLGCGDQRPQMLNVEKLRLQLPCSDKAFTFGQKVGTRKLGEDDQAYLQRRQKEQEKASYGDTGDSVLDWEVGQAEGGLSMYIHAVFHFGQVMEWSAANRGRR
jgi:hypothetical protein